MGTLAEHADFNVLVTDVFEELGEGLRKEDEVHPAAAFG